jgi:lipoate-protein ligase B
MTSEISQLETDPVLPVQDLGRVAYAPAYAEQVRRHERVLAARGSGDALIGEILLVEHEPVVTISRRPAAREHLVATPEMLARHGVAVEETDRGGDITYHGPGQLVVYPIVDLERTGLGVHDHVRLMERAVIEVCAELGIDARRDSTATGVWVNPPGLEDTHHPQGVHPRAGKIAAMGVRVRKWITMHGLSFNVEPDLAHFGLIVPCGLAGRPVTSLAKEFAVRGLAAVSMERVKVMMATRLRELYVETARAKRARPIQGNQADQASQTRATT